MDIPKYYNKKTSQKLIDSDIESFNRQFYSDFDTKYFLQKCLYLLAQITDKESLGKVFKSGVEYDKLKVKLNTAEFEEIFGKNYINNLKTEIVLTYYHAIETLFRLIFGHTVARNCPWIEISTQNDFKIFKRDVKDFLDRKYFKDHKQGIAYVFYGTTEKLPDFDQATWDKTISNLDNFLEHFAKDLSESYVYNNYKHGFTVFSGEAGFTFGDLLKAEKEDALVFLTNEKDNEQPGHRRLYKNILFTKWQQKWALVYTLTFMIENIISVGGWKYARKSYRARTFENLDLAKLTKEGDEPFQFTGMKISSISFKLPKNKKH